MMLSTMRSSCSLALGTVDTEPHSREVISHAKYMQAKEMSSRRDAGTQAPERLEHGVRVAVLGAREHRQLNVPGARQLGQTRHAADQISPHVGVPSGAAVHESARESAARLDDIELPGVVVHVEEESGQAKQRLRRHDLHKHALVDALHFATGRAIAYLAR